ncbi:hypothetical protein [Mesorhizobium sp. M2C.T.Ca.TU.002.02.1.1]|nr:hypothetical protein [Mesorhizobium sp. M2C.T.Ca.TU.002.02.1.1]
MSKSVAAITGAGHGIAKATASRLGAGLFRAGAGRPGPSEAGRDG